MNKENNILKLFFNQPTKHWHFEDIIEKADISRPQAALWLKKFMEQRLINRVKTKGKMPYYLADVSNNNYQLKKRLFILNIFEKSGFLGHLISLQKAKTIILFGSMNRWDWHENSDVDLFIYGDSEGFQKERYRDKLHRDIEIFMFKDRKELKDIKYGLLREIVEGYLIKGSLDFLEFKNA